jgi:hypothetical protein
MARKATMPPKEVEEKFSEPEPLPPGEELEAIHEEGKDEDKLKKLLKAPRRKSCCPPSRTRR